MRNVKIQLTLISIRDAPAENSCCKYITRVRRVGERRENEVNVEIRVYAKNSQRYAIFKDSLCFVYHDRRFFL